MWSPLVLLVVALLVAALPVGAEPPALIVGTSGDYPPFSMLEEDGRRGGFDIEVSERLGRDLGRPVAFAPFRWPELAGDLRSGRFQIAASGVTIRPERLLAGRFTRPYAVSRAMVLVRRAETARFPGVDAVNDERVRLAVNRGGHLEKLARANFPRARIEAVDDNRGLADRVVAGRADALVTESIEAQGFLAAQPALVALPPFSRDRKALFVAAGDRAAFAAADRWLAEREADGWLNEERRRWLGAPAVMTPAAARAECVAALVDQRLGLMPWVAAAKRQAGAAIEDPAREALVLARARQLAAGARLDAEAAASLFEALIEAAKAVQRLAPAVEPAATLDELRLVLADLDERLIQELAAGREVLRAADGQGTLAAGIGDLSHPGLDRAMRERIASTIVAAVGGQ